jgi:hypothetical protein
MFSLRWKQFLNIAMMNFVPKRVKANLIFRIISVLVYWMAS